MTTTTTTIQDRTLAALIAKREQARAELQACLVPLAAAAIEAQAIESAGLRRSDPARVALSQFMAETVARLGQAA